MALRKVFLKSKPISISKLYFAAERVNEPVKEVELVGSLITGTYRHA